LRNRFLINLSWELGNIFRFPFPEVLLVLFTVMVFLPGSSPFQISEPLDALSWNEVTYTFANLAAYKGAFFSLQAYLPLIILAAIFATLAFAYEIENGLLKVELSHPSSKRAIFVSKWLSCFLLVFATLSLVLLIYAFLFLTQNDAYLLANPLLILKMLLIAGSEAFFVVSFTVSFSIFSRKASVSLVGSFATLYIIQLASQTAGAGFLPPSSFMAQTEFLLRNSANQSAINLIIVPLVSVLLTVASYVYFSRRLELA
jgi:ABC-type transport system involved in multi-copper enzyme maturation permease subunit